MTPDASPTARALMTLAAIQDRPGITADRLAERLGVSSRAVRRYVEILREADIPVVSVRGPAGGYRLGRGMRLPPLVFSGDEALGLVMAVLDGHHSTETTTPVGAAVTKLLRALPQHVAEQADVVRRTAAATPDRSAARPDPATTVALVRASTEHQRLAISYRSEAGNAFSAEVEPWAVVVRHSRWYLLCRSVTSDGVRAYRVDRVTSVEPLAGRFEPPAGLDPVAALEEHLAVGWEHRTEVVIDAAVDELGWLNRTMGRLEPIDAASTRLLGSTSNLRGYAEDLAHIPYPLHVIDGPDLRAAVAELSRRLADATR